MQKMKSGKQYTAVSSLHFSSADQPARGAKVNRSNNPGNAVDATVSVTHGFEKKS